MILPSNNYVKHGAFALGTTPIDGSRRLVARLRPLGFHEIEPGIKGVHTMLINAESGCYVIFGDGGYRPLPPGRLLVAALCSSPAERRLLRRLIGALP